MQKFARRRAPSTPLPSWFRAKQFRDQHTTICSCITCILISDHLEETVIQILIYLYFIVFLLLTVVVFIGSHLHSSCDDFKSVASSDSDKEHFNVRTHPWKLYNAFTVTLWTFQMCLQSSENLTTFRSNSLRINSYWYERTIRWPKHLFGAWLGKLQISRVETSWNIFLATANALPSAFPKLAGLPWTICCGKMFHIAPSVLSYHHCTAICLPLCPHCGLS